MPYYYSLTEKERGRDLLPCFKRGPEKALYETRQENAPRGWVHSHYRRPYSEISQVSLEPIDAMNA
jgi:hypothetical protein